MEKIGDIEFYPLKGAMPTRLIACITDTLPEDITLRRSTDTVSKRDITCYHVIWNRYQGDIYIFTEWWKFLHHFDFYAYLIFLSEFNELGQVYLNQSAPDWDIPQRLIDIFK